MAKWNKRTKDEVEKIVNNLGYFLLDQYMDGKYRIVIIQDNCGYKYNVGLASLIQGHIPYFVAIGNSETLGNISLWLIQEEKVFELCENNEYKGNSKKLWFHCLVPECHENFDMSWKCIYSKSSGCPYCSGSKVSDKNRLSIVRPDIADQWDYKLNNDTPHDVSYASHKEKFWICPKGHESYSSIISSRTNGGNGCSRCADEQKESKVATELKGWAKDAFKYVDPEHRMFKNPETGSWLKCDIYLGEKESINGVYIEVHGEQHFKLNGFHNLLAEKKGTTPEEEFKYQKKLDKIKKKYARKNGTYIEVDLRKIKTTEEAISYIENIINNL